MAKLGDFTFHDLRRCALNNLRLPGDDYFTIMAITGHRTISVFRRYNRPRTLSLIEPSWHDAGIITNGEILMIQHDKLAKHPRLFKTLTSLSTDGLGQLLPAFKQARESDWISGTPGGCADDVVTAGAGDA